MASETPTKITTPLSSFSAMMAELTPTLDVSRIANLHDTPVDRPVDSFVANLLPVYPSDFATEEAPRGLPPEQQTAPPPPSTFLQTSPPSTSSSKTPPLSTLALQTPSQPVNCWCHVGGCVWEFGTDYFELFPYAIHGLGRMFRVDGNKLVARVPPSWVPDGDNDGCFLENLPDGCCIFYGLPMPALSKTQCLRLILQRLKANGNEVTTLGMGGADGDDSD